MRNGVLMTEASPAQLLEKYQTDSLEDVFLELSRKQQNLLKKRLPKSQMNEQDESLQMKIEENLYNLDFNANLQEEKKAPTFRVDRYFKVIPILKNYKIKYL